MANKQKPFESKKSGLFLVPNHLDIKNHKTENDVLCTEEMLKWPVRNSHTEPHNNEVFTKLYKNVLCALYSLAQRPDKLTSCVIRISIEADQDSKILILDTQAWAEIRVNDEHVLTLGYHNSKEHNPLCLTVANWVEQANYSACTESWEQDNIDMSLVKKYSRWSIETWLKYFKKKMWRTATLLKRAKEVRIDMAILMIKEAADANIDKVKPLIIKANAKITDAEQYQEKIDAIRFVIM